MTAAFERLGGSLLAVQEVPLDQVRRYGIVAGETIEEGLVKVDRMVEKPKPEAAPSRLGVAGPLHADARRCSARSAISRPAPAARSSSPTASPRC